MGMADQNREDGRRDNWTVAWLAWQKGRDGKRREGQGR